MDATTKAQYPKTKEPQPTKVQLQIVTGTAQQHVHPVTHHVLQPVPPQMAVRLQVADHRIQRMSAIGIPRQGHPAEDKSSPVRGRNAHLHTDLVALVRLALADALHFRRMQTVQLVPILLPQNQQPLGHGQFFRKHHPTVLPSVGISLNVPDNTAQVHPQPVHLAAHAPQLLGLHRSDPKTRLDRRLQDLLATGCPDATAKPCQAARVNGRAVLEILLPANVLPVGSLHLVRHHGLVRQTVNMPEILETHYQSGGLAGQSLLGQYNAPKVSSNGSQPMIPASRNSSWR